VTTRISHYEITGELGSGGMGVVYRARDTKLDRAVAIKVLRDGVGGDHDAQARFQREAKILASLNHPHIANIYGIEELEGRRFLVLELVDGETLAERIKRKPLETGEALEYARQIADALECAHEKGIIHRDLKPSNVKVSADGCVKVLDFGLAKSFTPSSQSVAPAGATATVTVSVTEPHAVLGTAPYMSPEQIRGEALDARTDIWSFGCLLYELLTNERAIPGNTTTEIIAGVLMSTPDMNRVPDRVPDIVPSLLRRCLQKDRRCRLRHIGDARLELEEALVPGDSARSIKRSPVTHYKWKIVALASLVLAVASLAVAAWKMSSNPETNSRTTRFAINLPAGSRIVASRNPSLALSPDGRNLFYIVPAPDTLRAFTPFIRPLDRFDPITPAAITGGVPMFSPNSASLCFIDEASMTLRRAALNGGAPQVITKLEGMMSQGDWGEDGFIYWTPAVRSGIARTPVEGGETVPVTQLDTSKAEQTHRHAQLLPGRQSMVFTVASTTTESFDDASIVAYSLDTKKRKTLIEGGFCARYSPSGHLVYARSGNLYAVAFDPKTLEVKGSPVAVVEGVLMSTNTGAAYYSISKNGTLAYVPGTAEGGKRQLVWVDRTGKETPLPLPERAYLYPRLSPDGKKLAIEIEGPAHDFHVYDFGRGVMTRMTLDGMSHAPVWSPDGKNIGFRSWREGGMTMWSMPADRSSSEHRLLPGKGMQSVVSWSPNGENISYVDLVPGTGADVFVLPVKGEPKPITFAQSKFAEGSPKFSADGKWLAYCSNESGRAEVYVQPFPGPGPKIQISSDGGTDPVWRRTGGELYYRNGDSLMIVDVRTGPGFTAGRPRELWRGHYSHGMSSSCGLPGVTSFNYEVTADGQKFLMVKDTHQDLASTRIHVVMGWSRELANLVKSN
jgi:eukaryotic-like serine/threonine-protein kinase